MLAGPVKKSVRSVVCVVYCRVGYLSRFLRIIVFRAFLQSILGSALSNCATVMNNSETKMISLCYLQKGPVLFRH